MKRYTVEHLNLTR